jgi:cytochrome c553
MSAMVQPLSSADMADIGAYLGSLTSNLVTRR